MCVCVCVWGIFHTFNKQFSGLQLSSDTLYPEIALASQVEVSVLQNFPTPTSEVNHKPGYHLITDHL